MDMGGVHAHSVLGGYGPAALYYIPRLYYMLLVQQRSCTCTTLVHVQIRLPLSEQDVWTRAWVRSAQSSAGIVVRLRHTGKKVVWHSPYLPDLLCCPWANSFGCSFPQPKPLAPPFCLLLPELYKRLQWDQKLLLVCRCLWSICKYLTHVCGNP
jgi:hypothetical protein